MFKTKHDEAEAPWTGRQWEYRTEAVFTMSDEWLNEFGQQGWELVAAVTPPAGKMRVFFRRPVEGDL